MPKEMVVPTHKVQVANFWQQQELIRKYQPPLGRPAGSPQLQIRCGVGGCRRVLCEIFDRPESWDGDFLVGQCPRHDTFDRPLAEERKRRVSRYQSPNPVWIVRLVKWRDLQQAFYLADTQERMIHLRADH